MMNENIVEVKDISKKIKKRLLVDALTFSVENNTICGLLGPNGSGKTTLIRMITGLIHPTKGQILIKQRDVAAKRKEAMVNIGAIVESPVFFPYMTGKENLINLARLHDSIPKEARHEQVNRVLNIVGLKGREHDKVRTYSLGMNQRLGIAQALLGDPPILILDEPANGLDPMGIRELRELLLMLKNEHGKTILISSHLLDELQKICDQIVVLHEGKLRWNGPLTDLAKHEESLEEAYIKLVNL